MQWLGSSFSFSDDFIHTRCKRNPLRMARVGGTFVVVAVVVAVGVDDICAITVAVINPGLATVL